MNLNVENCPVMSSDNLGIQKLKSANGQNEGLGQYFTPAKIAEFMASMLETPASKEIKILDPGAGGGVLTSAAVKELISRRNHPSHIEAHLYEIDRSLIETLNQSMSHLKAWAAQREVKFNYKIRNEDFVISNSHVLTNQGSLFSNENDGEFDVVISNPPYFKIPKDDPRAISCNSIVYGQPNIYSLFMGVSAGCLKTGGQFVFITPRSFAAGNYFQAFRKYLFSQISFRRFHLFESRISAFDRDSVLQENVITFGKKVANKSSDKIEITTSHGISDLNECKSIVVPRPELIDSSNILCLPSSENDLSILKHFKNWSDSLDTYCLKISTGPVVPFRATEFLQKKETETSVPLLWIQHALPMRVKFPLETFRKEQWIRSTPGSRKLLVSNSNMILMRRFSPKEDFRRLTVAPYIGGHIKAELLGLENHLNYIYRPEGQFSKKLVHGLSAFLNSKLFDSYFRITNGNTQVSATELRAATLPPSSKLEHVGALIAKVKDPTHETIDDIVNEVLEIESVNEKARRSLIPSHS